MLSKGIYSYKYMDDWEKFNKISLPEKEDFYSHLNMEDITGHIKFVKIWKQEI